MAYLSWISDEDLENAVLHVYQAFENAVRGVGLDSLQSKKIDPFSLMLEVRLSRLSLEDWLKNEKQRQVQKTIQNALGEMHQMILGSVDGWQDLETGHATGLDIANVDETVFAEIKNKYNTLNSSSAAKTYDKLVAAAENYPDATAYCVHIIGRGRHSYDSLWVRKNTSHPQVHVISGDLFYERVTGVSTAIQELYQALPKVIDNVIATNGEIETSTSTVVDDLRKKVQPDSLTEEAVMNYFFQSAYPGYSE